MFPLQRPCSWDQALPPWPPAHFSLPVLPVPAATSSQSAGAAGLAGRSRLCGGGHAGCQGAPQPCRRSARQSSEAASGRYQYGHQGGLGALGVRVGVLGTGKGVGTWCGFGGLPPGVSVALSPKQGGKERCRAGCWWMVIDPRAPPSPSPGRVWGCWGGPGPSVPPRNTVTPWFAHRDHPHSKLEGDTEALGVPEGG